MPAKKAIQVEQKQHIQKIRMAAYCRVSTDQDEQLSSYENQVRYYKEYIRQNPLYELVDIYADEGISGTNTKKRTEFNRLIADCRKGKVDRIIVKSISRFSRNTLDCLKYVRELKGFGIGITFEKENIDSLDAKGEVLLTILSSLAQDESRSISENATWGIRKKFERGEIRVNTTKFVGYDKGENGNLVINEEQAKIVRRIFRDFLQGETPESIARSLKEEGVPGWNGKANWYPTTIQRMLQNEKYMGDALLQKTYTVDFLTKRRSVNLGQVNQYYIEGNHEAIINKEEWDLVQLEVERRNQYRQDNHINFYIIQCEQNPFTCKVFCKECGGLFGRKNWTTSRGKRPVWQCNNRYKVKGIQGCANRHIDEETLQQSFLRALEILRENKEKLQEKWDNFSEEQKLEKYQATQLEEMLDSDQEVFNGRKMCHVLEKVTLGEDGSITIKFLEGTEVNL
ncbi:recombinase family protein [Streptococcus anginosus]|uniref:recombinase family protein n=2 Tax=Streptococcus anginosus TaxID=1328 RepID=UPI003A599466